MHNNDRSTNKTQYKTVVTVSRAIMAHGYLSQERFESFRVQIFTSNVAIRFKINIISADNFISVSEKSNVHCLGNNGKK